MDKYFKIIGTLLEIITFAVVIYKRKQLYKSSLRLLIVVMSFIIVTEMYAFVKLFFVEGAKNQSPNFIYYNIATIVVLLLYYGLYLENIHGPWSRKVFITACIITFSFYIFNISFIQTGQTFHTYSFAIGSVCLCLGIVFYLKEIVESEKIVFISQDPLFWISIGLFAFYIINIPYFGMYNYLLKDYQDFLILCKKIQLGLNYFMYCCIIKGLLCLKK